LEAIEESKTMGPHRSFILTRFEVIECEVEVVESNSAQVQWFPALGDLELGHSRVCASLYIFNFGLYSFHILPMSKIIFSLSPEKLESTSRTAKLIKEIKGIPNTWKLSFR
jgi:hypothetical protein